MSTTRATVTKRQVPNPVNPPHPSDCIISSYWPLNEPCHRGIDCEFPLVLVSAAFDRGGSSGTAEAYLAVRANRNEYEEALDNADRVEARLYEPDLKNYSVLEPNLKELVRTKILDLHSKQTLHSVDGKLMFRSSHKFLFHFLQLLSYVICIHISFFISVFHCCSDHSSSCTHLIHRCRAATATRRLCHRATVVLGCGSLSPVGEALVVALASSNSSDTTPSPKEYMRLCWLEA